MEEKKKKSFGSVVKGAWKEMKKDYADYQKNKEKRQVKAYESSLNNTKKLKAQLKEEKAKYALEKQRDELSKLRKKKWESSFKY